MPIYDYRCTSCGRVVEVLHSLSSTGPEGCEVCGGTLRRLISTPAIVFKGTGWAKKERHESSAARSDSGAGNERAGDSGASGPARESEAAESRGGSDSLASAGGSAAGGSGGDGASQRAKGDSGKSGSGAASTSRDRSKPSSG